MEIIYHNISQLHYPIGDNISDNKDKIINMANELAKIEAFKNAELTLICRGSSGAIIASIFAMILPNNCVIAHIKKSGENAHLDSLHLSPARKNIIVDDFICSGETMSAIYTKISQQRFFGGVDCVVITGDEKTLPFETKYYLCSNR